MALSNTHGIVVLFFDKAGKTMRCPVDERVSAEETASWHRLDVRALIGPFTMTRSVVFFELDTAKGTTVSSMIG